MLFRSPSNLTAITLQEHYDIHYAQGDFGACLRLGARLKLSPEEISILASKNSQTRIDKGTHNFINSEFQRKYALKRVANGTHPFLSGEIQRKNANKKIEEGTYHLVGKNSPNNTRSSCIWCRKETSIPVLARDHNADKCKQKN